MYLTYAAYFPTSGPPLWFSGWRGEDHKRLLLRIHSPVAKTAPAQQREGALDALFRTAPRAFIMGRVRYYDAEETVLVDVCSDYYCDAIGVVPLGPASSPLYLCRGERLELFKNLLKSQFADHTIYLIDKGFKFRVPGISYAKLRSLIAKPCGGISVIK